MWLEINRYGNPLRFDPPMLNIPKAKRSVNTCAYLSMNINDSGAAPLSKIVEKFKIFHVHPHLQFLSFIVCPNLCKIATFIHCVTV